MPQARAESNRAANAPLFAFRANEFDLAVLTKGIA